MKNILSEALSVIRGLLNQLLTNLEGDSGEEWLTEFKKFLRKEKCWVSDLLIFVGTVVVPATKKFVVADHFVVDASDNAPVKVSWLGDNFKSWFLDKVEKPVGKATLLCDKLAKKSVDEPILAALGDRAVTTMGQIYSLMAKQPKGEAPNGKDRLLSVDVLNIFYVYDDINGVLRAVIVDWLGGGWSVDAYSVEYPDDWGVGYLIFSRN